MIGRTLTSSVAALCLGGLAAQAQDFNAAPPSVPSQEPAFENQTRAPVMPATEGLKATTVVDGLVHPWALAKLPEGQGWLVTERPGRLRVVGADGHMSEPLTGLPEVDANGQGGLLDIALSPKFETDREVFFTFAEPRGEGKNATAVGKGKLNADLTAVEDATVIWQQQPAWDSDKHFGSRIVFDRDGNLFVTLGERSNPESRAIAQQLDNTLGKLVHITPEGQAVASEPPIKGALPEIYSMGHRNVQAATMGPDGQLWTVEMGPKGGDELNHPQAGKNYGWPIITYGEDYDGTPIGKGITKQDGLEQPVYYWDPVIAPSGMVFYDGAMFPDWKGQILTGGMKAQAIVRLKLEDGKVAGEARELEGIGRVRDIAVADDGALMLVTDADNGALIRVSKQ